MAGIENLKGAIEKSKELSKSIAKVAEGGLEVKDLFDAPKIVGEGAAVFSYVKSAKEAGELADLDGAEIKELLFALIDMGSDVYGLMKA